MSRLGCDVTQGSEFAALVLHDLTEPLRRLCLHAELLDEALVPVRLQEARILASSIERDAMGAIRMVEAACEVMLCEERPMDQRTLREIVVEARDLPNGFIVSWKDSMPDVESPNQFAYALRSLVRNAMKHHDQKSGSVTISYDAPWFQVTDDGPGFISDAQTGGLGLKLLGQLVHLVGGDMDIRRKVPSGTRVAFTWPVIGDCREHVPDAAGTTYQSDDDGDPRF